MQKIFDVNNKDDMDLLWSILPDDVYKIEKNDLDLVVIYYKGQEYPKQLIEICVDLHDKTKITRPMPEVTMQDIGKLCMFSYPQEDVSKVIGILRNIKKTTDGKNCYKMYGSRLWYIKCRRLAKKEIEELC